MSVRFLKGMDMAIRSRVRRAARRGYTLVESLVTIAIVGTLSSMLLPALQGARESARMTSCRHNISQVSKAMLTHESRLGHFPSGGWSPLWLGTADRPSGPGQPGGWSFALLPYAGQLESYDALSGLTPATAADTYRRTSSVAQPLFACPSRRAARPLPVPAGGPFITAAGPVSLVQAVRSDYAANGGSVGGCPPLASLRAITGNVSSNTRISISHVPPGNSRNCQSLRLPYNAVVNAHLTPNHPNDRLGPCEGCTGAIDATMYTPASLADGDAWQKATAAQRLSLPDHGIPDMQDGVVQRMSRLTAASLLDGLSTTYLIGEKFVPAARHESGSHEGDSAGLFAGYSASNVRWGNQPPLFDGGSAAAAGAFGSNHRAGWNVACADGAVRTVSFAIDPAAHKALSSRRNADIITTPW